MFIDSRWYNYRNQILGHILQGAAIGAGLASGEISYMAPAAGWLVMSVAYQYAGYIRKRDMDGYGDTIKRDIRDYMVGMVPGASLVALL